MPILFTRIVRFKRIDIRELKGEGGVSIRVKNLPADKDARNDADGNR